MKWCSQWKAGNRQTETLLTSLKQIEQVNIEYHAQETRDWKACQIHVKNYKKTFFLTDVKTITFFSLYDFYITQSYEPLKWVKTRPLRYFSKFRRLVFDLHCFLWTRIYTKIDLTRQLISTNVFPVWRQFSLFFLHISTCYNLHVKDAMLPILTKLAVILKLDRVGKHSSISPLTNKWSESKKGNSC